MKTNKQLVKKQRKFSVDFKKKIVEEFEQGQLSVLQLSKLYSLQGRLIYNWIYKFSTFNEQGCRIIEMKESVDKKIRDRDKKIAELERLLGQKQIKIEFLEKMIEIANEDLNIDIKKNSSTSPSTGSTKRGKK